MYAMSSSMVDFPSSESVWKFRFLNPNDINELKELCQVWFPVRYPDTWYIDVTSNKYYSLAAVHPYDGHILGVIVCDIKSLRDVNQEDNHLLCREQSVCEDTRVAYILSLGVTETFRRKHLGSAMLNKLLDYLRSPVMDQVRAVYLHVLATNTPAIRFYEKHLFVQHLFLPFYYHISGTCKDACSYVRYINGGQPEKTMIDWLAEGGRKALSLACGLFSSPLSRLFRLPTLLRTRPVAVLECYTYAAVLVPGNMRVTTNGQLMQTELGELFSLYINDYL